MGTNMKHPDVKQLIPAKSKADQLAKLFETKYAEDPQRYKALPGVTTNWGPEKIVMLYQFASNPEATQQIFADAIGVDRSGISRKCNSMDWPKFEQLLEAALNMTKEESIIHEAQFEKKKNTVKADVTVRKKLISKQAFYENLEHKILEASKHLKVKPLPTINTNSFKKSHTPEHMVLILSDMHVGQEFTREETGGINEYNLEIMHARAASLQKSLIDIYDIHSKAYDMPELHIFALGDNVQGGRENGEWGGAYTAHINVTDQAVLSSKVIANLIRSWIPLFKKITVTGVIGNHGRGGASKNSDAIGCNWDNVTYIALKAELQNEPKVGVRWSKTYWTQTNILGTEFMLVHGDYFSKSINSLNTANVKLYELSAAQKQTPFNVLCLGHFHSYTEIETSMGRIIVNGSWVGADLHALQHMRVGSRPTQTVFGVHPKRGITWRYPLDLENVR
jgi:hypothetical protein